MSVDSLFKQFAGHLVGIQLLLSTLDGFGGGEEGKFLGSQFVIHCFPLVS